MQPDPALVAELRFDPNSIYRETLFSSWNEYTASCKQAWSKHPPKDSPCGRYMVFSQEYENAISAAKSKKDKAMADCIKKIGPYDA